MSPALIDVHAMLNGTFQEGGWVLLAAFLAEPLVIVLALAAIARLSGGMTHDE